MYIRRNAHHACTSIYNSSQRLYTIGACYKTIGAACTVYNTCIYRIVFSWGRSCCNSIVSVYALLYKFCDLKNRRHIKMIIKIYTPRTFSLLSTWKINTNRPCSELKIENNHANASVLLLT